MGVTWFELNHQKFHTLVLFIEGTLKLTKMSNDIKLQCFIMQIGFNETIKIILFRLIYFRQFYFIALS